MGNTVAVIDYGMGNLHSIAKALKKASPTSNVIISAKPEEILAASHVVFPGVGAIRDCMHTLQQTGLDKTIKEVAQSKPLLGICIGMQALMQHSEENNGVDCLGILAGNAKKFTHGALDSAGNTLKIPHMGWSQVKKTKENPLFRNIDENERFYFVHSYFVIPTDTSMTIAETEYPDKYSCALQHNNIVAVQFHPEKSQHAGIQLLKNFLDWDGSAQLT